MNLDTWLTFTILEILVCLTPGPAVVFITSTAVNKGAKAAYTGTCGILAGNVLYFALSATGVAAILLASPVLFTSIRWLGCAYLVYLAVQMIRRGSKASRGTQETGNAVAESEKQNSKNNVSVMHGFMVQALNPKAITYFVALLPQFISPASAIVPQIAILTLTSLIIETSILSLYIGIAVRSKRYASTRYKGLFTSLAGGFLLIAATRLAFSSQA